MDKNSEVIGCLVLLLVPFIVLASMAIGGFVFLQGYTMLALPLFELPSINFGQAVMVSSFLGYITAQYTPNNSDNSNKSNGILERFITSIITLFIVRPLLWLLIFWIAVNVFN